MFTRFWFRMEEADPAPGGGGAGGGILEAGAGTPPPADDTPPAFTAPEWLTGVEEEYANTEIMKSVNDLPTLVKNYVHAQKMVGADKVVLPSKHATPDEWRGFFEKAGLPKTAEEYSVKMPEGDNEESFSEFKAKAFELGLMPHQAEALYTAQHEKSVAAQKAEAEAYQETVNNTTAELKEEYGEAFPTKMKMAVSMIEEIATPEMKAYIEEAGLNSDGTFIRMMVTAAEKFGGEGSFDSHTNPIGTLSPSEAQKQIDAIMNNGEHPYYDSAHPNHASAVKEVEKLFSFTV